MEENGIGKDGKMRYRIGTRGSKLALTQAKGVCERLTEAYPEDEFEIQVVRTKGDVVLDKPLHEMGERGVFVKEIEEKILSGEIQIGVHSMKDMPAFPAQGLLFAKPWKREDPRDVLVLREKKSLDGLREGAVVGTGSRRREFQLKRLRPDLKVVDIRGNVDTRLRKMEEDGLDGILLAAAGLHRLGMEDKITQYLEVEEMIPAPAQGILALEIREGEERLLEMLDALSDADTAVAAEAERGFLQQMGGSCHIPVGAACQKVPGGAWKMDVMFGNETGSQQAYGTVQGKDGKELADKAADLIRQKMGLAAQPPGEQGQEGQPGTVCLVGAGPGDPGLLTIKGQQAIQAADCIIYDRLASPKLLEEAKDGCEMIYVGKASHNHTMRQEDINCLLVKKSMEYQKVVRLKGGDAYVFGRGGEEALFLREHGVPFEVVPGVSSCMAGLAYAGIPITHRGTAFGFHVVTAHSKNDGLAEIDFQAMARGGETCVFLMGLSKVREIADRLQEAGMPGSMEAAVISNATTPGQKACVSDLAHIAQEVERAKLVSPAMIVVGKVVSLREQLDFFERRPLFGRQYLVPKIGPKSTRLRGLLEEQGAAVDEVQVGEIVKIARTFTAEQLKGVDWMVFTSQNGVDSFFESLEKSSLDLRSLAGCKIAVIGSKTAEALKQKGIYADLVPQGFHSDALAQALKSQCKGKEKVWYLKAGNADSHLKEALEGQCEFEEISVYENRGCCVEANSIRPMEEYDGVLFTCASSAGRLIDAMGKGWKPKQVYSIGPKTTAFLKANGVAGILEAQQSTYKGLLECVLES